MEDCVDRVGNAKFVTKLDLLKGRFPVNIFPVAQLVEHGVSNAKIMGSIPRESKS